MNITSVFSLKKPDYYSNIIANRFLFNFLKMMVLFLYIRHNTFAYSRAFNPFTAQDRMRVDDS